MAAIGRDEASGLARRDHRRAHGGLSVKLSHRPGADEVERAKQEAIRLIQGGRAAPAARLMRDLLSHRPEDFDVLHLLGAARVKEGKWDDGIRHLERAAAIKPGSLAVWVNLGGALEALGRRHEAIDCYAKAAELQPNHAELNHRLCLARIAAGLGDTALAQAQAFAERQPASDLGHTTLGLAFTQAGRLDEAVASFRTATQLRPTNSLASANLGYVLGSQRRYAEAAAVLSRVVAAQPKDWQALEKLIHAKRYLCDWDQIEALETRLVEAVDTQSIDIDPLALMNVTDRADLLFRCARNRQALNSGCQGPALRVGRTPAHSRIRIGYVSGDFREHPVGHVVADLIGAHDRSRFEIFGISYGPDDGSPIRARLEKTFDRFIDVAASDPTSIARQICELEVDIAVDLSGATEAGLPTIMNHRCAPVQVAFLGYPGTSGAPRIDYIVADPIVIAQSSERFYSERVVRLPDSYFPPSARAIRPMRPSRQVCGLPEEGFVFCCFNSIYKISRAYYSLWMRILRAVPGSVLWLRSPDEATRDNLRAAAEAQGVAGERVVFAPHLPLEADHLARFQNASLFLDTAPYNAHTTASDALWVGVPVLTCAGASFASRVGASLLTAAGLPELVMTDHSQYEAKAVALAQEPQALARLKSRLLDDRASNRLFNLDRYRQHIETAYLSMHERAGKGLEPSHLAVPPISAPGT